MIVPTGSGIYFDQSSGHYSVYLRISGPYGDVLACYFFEDHTSAALFLNDNPLRVGSILSTLDFWASVETPPFDLVN